MICYNTCYERWESDCNEEFMVGMTPEWPEELDTEFNTEYEFWEWHFKGSKSKDTLALERCLS